MTYMVKKMDIRSEGMLEAGAFVLDFILVFVYAIWLNGSVGC